jgi:hypothetical protein
VLVNINRKPFRIAVDHDPACTVVVVSHERSGTHFLMNSLAMNSRYTVDPFLNFDHETLAHEVNFHSEVSVRNFFDGLRQMKAPRGPLVLKSIIKSHHTREFLEPVLGRPEVRILYVYRHPVDMMVSFWRFLHRWDWHEGPKTDTPLALARRAPEGRLLRYQHRHVATFFDRWAHHVNGWLAAAGEHPNVMGVPYSSLCATYETQVRAVLSFLEQPHPPVVLPPPRESYIQGRSQMLAPADQAALVLHIEQELTRFPALLSALGTRGPGAE